MSDIDCSTTSRPVLGRATRGARPPTLDLDGAPRMGPDAWPARSQGHAWGLSAGTGAGSLAVRRGHGLDAGWSRMDAPLSTAPLRQESRSHLERKGSGFHPVGGLVQEKTRECWHEGMRTGTRDRTRSPDHKEVWKSP